MTKVYGPLVVLLAAVAATMTAYLLYPAVEGFLRRHVVTYADWVTATRKKMFAPVRRTRVYLAIALSTFLLALCGYLLSAGFGLVTFLFTLLFGYTGWAAPKIWVRIQWQQRLKKFDQQLVDGLNLMSNSLKSGLNLGQVIQVLVAEMPNPISQEFALVLSQQQLGLSLEEAMEKMLERIPSDDLSVAIHSILILRETGGDLSETFDVIASTIRERRKVDGKIRAMTQQGKTQGLLLFIMPFAIGLMLYFMNPDFMLPMVTTRLGWMLISVMLFFQLIGGLWIRKIVRIDV